MSACRHYDRRRCTGCTRLHEPYARQLAAKGEYVRHCVAEVPGAVAALKPVVPSPAPLGYRATVKLCLSQDREGRRAVGLYRAGGKEVAPVPDCPALTPAVRALVARLFGREVRPPAAFYDHRGRVFQRGRLKFFVARGGDAAIISHTGVPREALVKWLKAAGLAQLCAYESKLTPADGDLPIGRHLAHLSGPERAPFKLGGRVHELSPGAFFQANEALAEALVAGAVGFASQGDVLLDLFGGFGAYTFAAAERFKKVYLVDGNRAAIDAAARTATAAGVAGVAAVAAYCEDFLEKLGEDMAARVTHVIVNPPRGGLSRRVTQALLRLPDVRALHYVSCNPQTLARDLQALVGGGRLRVRDVTPYDMFPQTEHVEVVAKLA